MQYKFLFVSIAAISLASCSGGGSTASGPVKRDPGNWKTEMKLVKMDVPGMPASAKEQMSKAMANAAVQDMCITKEQADKEDMAKEFSKGGAPGADCTFSKNVVAGGKIDVAGTCKGPAGEAINLVMAGTVAAKKIDMNMKVTGPSPTGKGETSMEMQVTGTNTGPCKTS